MKFEGLVTRCMKPITLNNSGNGCCLFPRDIEHECGVGGFDKYPPGKRPKKAPVVEAVIPQAIGHVKPQGMATFYIEDLDVACDSEELYRAFENKARLYDGEAILEREKGDAGWPAYRLQFSSLVQLVKFVVYEYSGGDELAALDQFERVQYGYPTKE